jgi:hypothetical protein
MTHRALRCPTVNVHSLISNAFWMFNCQILCLSGDCLNSAEDLEWSTNRFSITCIFVFCCWIKWHRSTVDICKIPLFGYIMNIFSTQQHKKVTMFDRQAIARGTVHSNTKDLARAVAVNNPIV